MIENIDEIRINDFIMSLSDEKDCDILELKKFAITNNVPIIRDEIKSFLRLLLEIKKPNNILEIGTAIAYSTLVIHKMCKDANIVTIENYEKRVNIANDNIDRFFDKNKVKLINCDAGDFLSENKYSEYFDFIFLDAAKAQYINWIDDIKKVMKKNAVLISDNIFKDGEILESKLLIRKRDRTIHKRMREFLQYITKDNEFNTYIFNIGDGISVSIKK